MNPDINFEEAKRFLNIIDPDGNFTFQTVDDNKDRNTPKLRKIIHRENNANFAKLVRLNQAGAGIFVMINQGDGKSRKTKNIQSIRALFVDLDENGKDKLKKIMSLPIIAPRMVIESSPRKFHIYWQIDGELPIELFKPLQLHLAEQFGGDPSICDPSRVMRLPGFNHQKKEPFQTRIMHDNTGAPPLPVELLIEKIKFKIDKQKQKQTIRNKIFQSTGWNRPLPSWLPDALNHIDPEPYNQWLYVGMALHHETGGNNNGLQVWIDWCKHHPKPAVICRIVNLARITHIS